MLVRVSRVVEREHAGKGSKHEKKTYQISFRGEVEERIELAAKKNRRRRGAR